MIRLLSAVYCFVIICAPAKLVNDAHGPLAAFVVIVLGWFVTMLTDAIP